MVLACCRDCVFVFILLWMFMIIDKNAFVKGYSIIGDKLSWDDAIDRCRDDLVSVMDQRKYDEINGYLQSQSNTLSCYWIYLYFDKKEHTLKDRHGDRATWFHWYPNPYTCPDVFKYEKADECCVALQRDPGSSSFLMMNMSCSESQCGGICDTPLHRPSIAFTPSSTGNIDTFGSTLPSTTLPRIYSSDVIGTSSYPMSYTSGVATSALPTFSTVVQVNSRSLISSSFALEDYIITQTNEITSIANSYYIIAKPVTTSNYATSSTSRDVNTSTTPSSYTTSSTSRDVNTSTTPSSYTTSSTSRDVNASTTPISYSTSRDDKTYFSTRPTTTHAVDSTSSIPDRQLSVRYEKFEGVLRSWDETRRFCMSKGMGMVKVRNINEYNRFKEFLFNGTGQIPNDLTAWVGMKWNETIAQFMWNSGEPLTFDTNWAYGHPLCHHGLTIQSCPNGEQNCVSLYENVEFQTDVCKNIHPVICEKVVSPTSTNTTNFIQSTSMTSVTSEVTRDPLNATPSFPSITEEGISTTVSPSMTSFITDPRLFHTQSPITPSSTKMSSIMSSPPSVITPSRDVDVLMSWSSGDYVYHAFKGHDGGYTWYTANRFCSNLGMKLLMIKDLEILQKVGSFLKEVIKLLEGIGQRRHIWLGMYHGHGGHKWINNETVKWANWGNGEPNCLGHQWSYDCQTNNVFPVYQNCVVIDKTLFFNSVQCEPKQIVICQEEYTRPKVLNCTCPKRLINKKWKFLDGAKISEKQVTSIVEEDFDDNVKPFIAVDKKKLSIVVRKKISAQDDRPAAQTIGWTAVALVFVPLGFLVMVDVMTLFQLVSNKK